MKQKKTWIGVGNVALSLGLLTLVLQGCSRLPEPAKNGSGNTKQKDSDDGEASPDKAVYPLLTAESISAIRKTLPLVDVLLQRPEGRSQAQLSSAERELLANRFHLDRAEL